MKFFLLLFAFLPFVHADEHFCIQDQILQLEAAITNHEKKQPPSEHYHILKSVANDALVLEDESKWAVGWWYTSVVKDWKKGDKLKIVHQSGSMKFENMRTLGIAWCTLEKKPQSGDYIARKPVRSFDSDQCNRLILGSGWIYQIGLCNWKVRDQIFVFYSDEANQFTLWNLTCNEIMSGCVLLGNEKEGSSESILNLEKKLNSRVLGQKEATEAIKAALFNYWIGINDPKMPIGVFLFLGPTGVGKTELVKALTEELFKSQSYLTRFDMSHFAEGHTISRLVGSPPGYVNHEEGGQLTEALRLRPRSVVLLDEMEKAHPVVRKMFLPVFDEGYVCDAKNRKIPCTNTIFIMTSNICGQEIAKLFAAGYSAEQVLTAIEPAVMETLSPELYNRTIPIVFHSLTPDLMKNLVDLMLNDVIQTIKEIRQMDVVVDENAKAYLAKHGFHPTLGARPLKRLIQKEVVATLSYAIVVDSIPENSRIYLSYSSAKGGWQIYWERV